MKIEMTLRSKMGWGYRTGITTDSKGWHIDPPILPDYIGTMRTVSKAIQNDRTFQSIRNGTIYCSRWFIRKGGVWHPITDKNLQDKTYELDNKFVDLVEIEIE